MSQLDFNDENPYQKRRPLAKPKPWPIKLAMKLGVKTEQQANLAVITVSVILIILTIIIYKNLFFNSNDGSETFNIDDITLDEAREIKKSGVSPDDLSPEMIDELKDRGIDVYNL